MKSEIFRSEDFPQDVQALFEEFKQTAMFRALQEIAQNPDSQHRANRVKDGYENALKRWFTFFTLAYAEPQGFVVWDPEATEEFYEELLSPEGELRPDTQNPFRRAFFVRKNNGEESRYLLPLGLVEIEGTGTIHAVLEDSLSDSHQKGANLSSLAHRFPSSFSDPRIIFVVPHHPSLIVPEAIAQNSHASILQLPFDRPTLRNLVQPAVEAVFPTLRR